MIDYFNLISTDKNSQIFYAAGSEVWQTWTKPNGCKFVHFYLLGGGGGGSSGRTDVTFSVTREGGGGGGSSSFAQGYFPSNLIPDTLFVCVGMGGSGQTSIMNGTSGGISFISISPTSADTANIILRSGNVGATCSNARTGGIGGTVFVGSTGILSFLGQIQNTVGSNGLAGGTNASPVGSSISAYFLTGGAGGGAVRSVGNSSNNGGGLTGSGYIPTIGGGNTTGNPNGLSNPLFYFPTQDYGMNNPMTFIGGLGGAGLDATNGGDGGDGSYGCGGGGGGGSTTGNGIGGRGGNGGNGLVIITSW